MRQERESQLQQNTFLTSFYHTSPKKRGPQYSANSTPAMWGDDDEEPVANEVSSINDRFQANMLSHLKEIMALTQEIKRINQKQLETTGPATNNQNSILKRQKTRHMRSMTQNEEELDEKVVHEEGVRKNLSIYFGHENWNLVLNMMIGIRKAVKNLHPLNDDIPINENHFQMKYQFEIITKRTA